jgi:hypothetical protein
VVKGNQLWMIASLPITVLQTLLVISLTGPLSGLFPRLCYAPSNDGRREAYGTQGTNAHSGGGECTEEIGGFPHGVPLGATARRWYGRAPKGRQYRLLRARLDSQRSGSAPRSTAFTSMASRA